MAIAKEELDEIVPQKSIPKDMEKGKFYSRAEIVKMVLGKDFPANSEELQAYLKGKDVGEVIGGGLFPVSQIAYVDAIIVGRAIRGELTQGRKGDMMYYAKA